MKSDARASKHSSKRERARTRRSGSEASSFVNLLIASLKGGGCTILSMLVLSLIMSAAALLSADYTPLIFPLARPSQSRAAAHAVSCDHLFCEKEHHPPPEKGDG